MNSKEFISCLFQTCERLGILSLQEGFEFRYHLLGCLQSFRTTQPFKEAVNFAVMTVG